MLCDVCLWVNLNFIIYFTSYDCSCLDDSRSTISPECVGLIFVKQNLVVDPLNIDNGNYIINSISFNYKLCYLPN